MSIAFACPSPLDLASLKRKRPLRRWFRVEGLDALGNSSVVVSVFCFFHVFSYFFFCFFDFLSLSFFRSFSKDRRKVEKEGGCCKIR